MVHEPVSQSLVAAGYLRWIPLLPLLGVLFHVLVGYRAGRRAVGLVACGSVAAAFALAVAAFVDVVAADKPIALIDTVYTWMASGDFSADIAFTIDPLSSVMCLVVTGVGFLIHLYSTGYMDHDPDFARFFAYLNLFTAVMLVLILADNLVLMFVGWEGVGLCSYLLIGFWHDDPAKASAGKKAFVVNRIGDAGFVIGTLLLFWASVDLGHPSLRFADINLMAPSLAPALATAIALFLFVGATGKSAQIPLFVWLPDAMAGPTPVSALIHAATMVTAGVYMIARLHGVYVEAPAALQVIAIVGALTALGAASIGLVQNDIKKVLAYSTVSQLGYMFLALGVGAFGAAIFHVVTHAFFKALLFLGAGSVIHALHEEQDIRRMGGLSEKMRITWLTFWAGTLAIAGVPLLSGFFSKDEILAATFDSGHHVLWAVGLIGAAMTAFYMTRLTVLTFHGAYRGDPERFEHAHESPLPMSLPLIVLAVFAVIAGYAGVPTVLGGSNWFGHYLEPSVGHHQLHLAHSTEYVLMGLSILFALTGMFLAYRTYNTGPDADARFVEKRGGLASAMQNAYFVDEAYNRGIAGGVLKFAGFLSSKIDVGLIDAIVNSFASTTAQFSDGWRRWTSGNLQHYALTMLLGAAVVAVFLFAGVRG